MDCVAIEIVMQVILRRSISRLQEVFAMAMELGAAILVAVRFSGGMAVHLRPSTPSSPAISRTTTATTTYYYSPVAASMISMSRLDRH
uniref:Uncharacterized protein n=1 Tax=Leersia perrieri TaxID=77586 RepID=A0A0D9VAK9_9ORYZ